MGILLIVMLFLATVGVGWWELQRSKRRFKEVQVQLHSIYSEIDNSPNSESSDPSEESAENQDQD